MKKYILSIVIIICIIATSCSNNGAETVTSNEAKIMHIQPSVAMQPQVRVSSPSENSFVFDDQDAIGISIVNESALLTGAEMNFNTKFTKTNSIWQQEMHTYWLNDATGTRNDIIGYYPYIENIQEPSAVPLTFITAQSTAEQVAQCDFLWGKNTVTKSSSNDPVSLQMQHAMTKLTFNVKFINGYEAYEGIENLQIFSRTNISLNLSTGKISAIGNLMPITPYKKDLFSEYYLQTYEAIIAPQDYKGETFITFTLAGKSYSQPFTYSMLQGKHYTFLISVSEDAAPNLLLISTVNIDNWGSGETDDETIITKPQYKIGDLWPDETSPVAIVLSERIDNSHPGIMMNLNKIEARLVSTQKYVENLKSLFKSKSGKSNMRALKTYIEKNNLSWNDFPAVKQCADLGDEWFIPTIYELEESMLNFHNQIDQEKWFKYVGYLGEEVSILTLSFDESFSFYIVGNYQVTPSGGFSYGGIYNNITSYAQMRAFRYY